MLFDFDDPWLRLFAFVLFFFIWYALSRAIRYRYTIASPRLEDVIDTLVALVCWSRLYYPSPLFWYLVFVILRRRIPQYPRQPRAAEDSTYSHEFQKPFLPPAYHRSSRLSQPPSTNDRHDYSHPPRIDCPFPQTSGEGIKFLRANTSSSKQVGSIPVNPDRCLDQLHDTSSTVKTQLLSEDTTRLLKELIRKPIVVPNITGMDPHQRPVFGTNTSQPHIIRNRQLRPTEIRDRHAMTAHNLEIYLLGKRKRAEVAAYPAQLAGPVLHVERGLDPEDMVAAPQVMGKRRKLDGTV